MSALEKHSGLANSILEYLKSEDGTITETESHGAYNKNLPEGITPDTVEALSNYNAKFVSAAHAAVGEMAADIFAKDKKRENVQAQIGFFGKNDTIEIDVSRKETFTNHYAKEGEPKEVVKPLFMSTTVNIKSAKGIGLKAIKQELSKTLSSKFES